MYYFLEDASSEKEFFASISYANYLIACFLDIGKITIANKYRADVALLKSHYPEYQL